MGEKSRAACPTNDGQKIYQLGREIINNHWDGSSLYQTQVTAINPLSARVQKGFFEKSESKNTALTSTINSINHKYGAYTISPAQLL